MPGSEESDYRPLHDRVVLELPTQAGRSIELFITALKPLQQQQPCDESASQSWHRYSDIHTPCVDVLLWPLLPPLRHWAVNGAGKMTPWSMLRARQPGSAALLNALPFPVNTASSSARVPLALHSTTYLSFTLWLEGICCSCVPGEITTSWLVLVISSWIPVFIFQWHASLAIVSNDVCDV
ncbi:hypothetical protein CI102_514 [Trichoderma harzianum]|jgi:hypothetical protein|nr:hypothetical protein CI102_514 [Trichoderma harzianum]